MFKSGLKISKKQIGLILVDILIIWLSIKLGYLLRSGYGSSASLGYIISNLFIYVTTFYIGGLYDFKTDFRKKKELLNITVAIGAATLAIIVVFYMGIFFPPGRGIFLIQTTFVFLGIVAWRVLYSRVAVAGIFSKKALIVGCGKGGKMVASLINQLETSDIKIVGFLDTNNIMGFRNCAFGD